MRAAALLALLIIVPVARAATLHYRDFRRLADDLRGLSGIAHAGEDRYYAVADNSDRVYPMAITVTNDGGLEHVEVQRPWRMKQRSDYEGIALGRSPDRLFVSDESPAVGEYMLPDMRRVATLPVPEVFRQIVANNGFESLTVTPDGRTLWVANERALKVDGNPQTLATPMLSVTRLRLQRYEIGGDGKPTPREQFEYQTSGVHDWGGTIGLCDLAALPDGRLLALERSAAKNFSGQVSIRSRVFLVDTAGATDISRPPYDTGLVGTGGAGVGGAGAGGVAVEPPPVPARKALLFDGFVCDANGENLEGLCLGRKLAEGRFAVIGVVDNTDGGLGASRPAVVSFELELDAAAPTSAPTKPQ